MGPGDSHRPMRIRIAGISPLGWRTIPAEKATELFLGERLGRCGQMALAVERQIPRGEPGVVPSCPDGKKRPDWKRCVHSVVSSGSAALRWWRRARIARQPIMDHVHGRIACLQSSPA